MLFAARHPRIILHLFRPLSSTPSSVPLSPFITQFLPPHSPPPPSSSDQSFSSNINLLLIISISNFIKTSPQLHHSLLSHSNFIHPPPFSLLLLSFPNPALSLSFFQLSLSSSSPYSIFTTCLLIYHRNLSLSQLLLSSILSLHPSWAHLLLSWASQHPCRYCSILHLSLRAFIDARMLPHSLQIVQTMRDHGFSPSLSVLAMLLRLLFRAGEDVAAWKLFKDMLAGRGPFPTVRTFNAMILGFCHKGSVGVGLALNGIMSKRFGIDPDACSFNILMKAYCVLGQLDGAFKVFALMLEQGCEPTVVTYNVLVDGLCREGRMDAARELFDKMGRVGIEYNTVSYNAIISGYVKAGQIENADRAYGEMRERGLPPDCRTFNILVAGYSKFRRKVWREEREKLLNQMLSLEEAFLDDSTRLDVLVSSYCLNGQLDDAREWLQHALESGVPASTAMFNSVIAACSNRGLDEEALNMYHLMVEAGLSPSATTCNSLLMGLCKSGRLDEAQELMNKMVQRGFCVNISSYTICIVGYFRAGDVVGAHRCWNEMKRQGIHPDVIAYSAYINGLCQAKYMKEAQNAFYEMGTRGLIPNNFVYNSLISGFCRTGNIEEALTLEREMRKRGFDPDIFTTNIIIDGYCRERMMDKAVYKLLETYDIGMKPDIVTYNTFVSAYCKACDMGSAVNFLNRMHSDGWEPDIFTYNMLIHALCSSHMMGEAMRKLDELISAGLVPDSVTCNTVMNGICVDVLDRAIIMTGKLLKIAFVPNSVTVNLILTHFCKQNMAKRALMWAKKLSEVSFIFDDSTKNILSWARDKQEMEDVSMVDSGKGLLLDFLLHITYEFLLRNERPNSRPLMISCIVDHGFAKSSNMMDVR